MSQDLERQLAERDALIAELREKYDGMVLAAGFLSDESRKSDERAEQAEAEVLRLSGLETVEARNALARVNVELAAMTKERDVWEESARRHEDRVSVLDSVIVALREPAGDEEVREALALADRHKPERGNMMGDAAVILARSLRSTTAALKESEADRDDARSLVVRQDEIVSANNNLRCELEKAEAKLAALKKK